uniref:YKT6 v-SNARE homolog (S. cerevisiae) n=1 Tax=Sinocyclocheilus grahami TaxID=75366 RepID=A0A672LZR0_SINGR
LVFPVLQNPREADAMTKVQAELDETKIILHNTMESLLERGEKLDDLVQKSEHLGNQSKAFYKTVSTLHTYETWQQKLQFIIMSILLYILKLLLKGS